MAAPQPSRAEYRSLPAYNRLVAMGASGAFSWSSELPSGRSPFWIRDEALAGVGLHPGDAVSVDTRVDPKPGDLVVVEAELEDGDAVRTARRLAAVDGAHVRLESLGSDLSVSALDLSHEQVIVLGVIRARLRVEDGGARMIEEPLT
jgi:hypothetical protein